MNRKNVIGIYFLVAVFVLGVICAEGFSISDLFGLAGSLEGEIVVSTSEKLGNINPDIYGLFMATVFRHFDGGIWAEMLKSRKFAEHDREDISYGIVREWFTIGQNNKTHFEHDNTIFYTGRQSQKIISEDANNKRTGIGQKGLYFNSQRTYHIRVNLRQNGISGPVTIALEGKDAIYKSKDITVSEGDWQRFNFELKPAVTDKDGRFTITFPGRGTLWLGSVSMMPDDNVAGYRKEVVAAMKALRPPNIRWPGGCNVDCYRWQQTIGDRDKRPAVFNRAFPRTRQWLSQDTGIDEFMDLCRAVGTKPFIIVNAGDGTAKEAANMVEYCNGSVYTKYGALRARNGHPQPYNIKLWGIGNELFGNWEPGHTDRQTYARKCVAFAKAMRAVDKNLKFVVCGGRYWKFPRWNQALFKIAGDHFDYLSLHSYAKKYRNTLKKEDLNDPKMAEELYYYLASSPYGIEEQIIETDKEIRAALPNRPDITVSFDEWNAFYYKPGPFEELDFAQRDGIYTAGVFHAFRRQHKAVKIANIWGVINSNGMIRVNPSGMFFNPQYLIFKMYADRSGPTLLKTDVKCDSFPAPEYERGRPQAKGRIPYLDVSATMSNDEKTIYVAVVNLHANKNIKTPVSLNQWNFSSKVKIAEFYDDDYMTENTFENPNRLTIKENTLNGISNPFTYTFKPHSVTIFEFQKK